MVIRRPDGLYDIPEANLSGVPESYIPEHLRVAPDAAYMPVPELPPQDYLASLNEGGSTSVGQRMPGEQWGNVSNTPPPAPQPQQGEGGRTSRSLEGSDTQNSYESAPGKIQNTPSQRSGGWSEGIYEWPKDPAPEAAQKTSLTELNGPEEEKIKNDSFTPADKYFQELMRQAGKSSAGTYVPEHQAKTGESWVSEQDVPRLGATEVPVIPGERAPTGHWVDKPTEEVFVPDAQGGHMETRGGPEFVEDPQEGPGMWVTKKGKDGKPEKTWVPVAAEPSTKIIPNADLNKAAKSLQSETENETEAHATDSLQRAGGQARAIGDLELDAAAREKALYDRFEADYLAHKDDVDNAQKQWQDTVRMYLDELKREPTPAPLGRRIIMGLAQGLIYGGAALANQQVPHLDWIGDAVKTEAQKQLALMNAYGHIAGLQLNNLHRLNQKMDPISALHTLQAGLWTQVGHEAEALATKYKQGEAFDAAINLRDQANKKAADILDAASSAHWKQLIQTIPAQNVGGRQGGLPGMLAAIDKLMKGAPKETIEAAKNKLISQMQKGEGYTFPDAQQKPGRVEVEVAKDQRSRSWKAPNFMGGQQLYAARDEDARKYQSYAADVEELIAQVTRIKGLVAQVGSTISPDIRRAIETEQRWLMGTARRIANTGVPQAFEIEQIIAPMIGMDVNEIIKVASREKILDNVIEAAQRSAFSHTATGSFLDPELKEPFQPNTKRKAE